MDRLTVSISPYADNSFGGVVFTVTAVVNGFGLPEWLDVDEFFRALTRQGQLPVFNCSCGVLGCGGYYIDVERTSASWVWRNRYRSDDPRARPHAEYRFEFTWENVREAAGELLATLYTIMAQRPGESVHSSTTGPDLAERLPHYVEVYNQLPAARAA